MERLPLDPLFYSTLSRFAGCFTRPSFANFVTVCCGWVQCVQRCTVTGMLEAAGVAGQVHHERYHRLFARARFEPDQLGQRLCQLLVEALVPTGAIVLAGDDTLFHKSGRKVFGAGFFRDAVLSHGQRVVTRWGLNYVVLGLVVRLPLWPGRDICLPLLARLHQPPPKDHKSKAGKAGKAGKASKASKASKATETTKTAPAPTLTPSALLLEMVQLVVQWLPGRTCVLVVDGAYANAGLGQDLPPQVQLISRPRRDAALHELPPAPTGRRGRPRVKGARLPSPRQRVQAADLDWETQTLAVYGETRTWELASFGGLWPGVAKARPLRFVLVRKPERPQDWVCLCCTQVEWTAAQMVAAYAGRWSIEVVFHEAKSGLGLAEPQARTAAAVQRVIPLGLMLVSLIKYWYVTHGQYRADATVVCGRWNRTKRTPAFSDMLATLRQAGWQQLFNVDSARPDEWHHILEHLTIRLARAA